MGGGNAGDKPLKPPPQGKGNEDHQDGMGNAHHQVNDPVNQAVQPPGSGGCGNACQDGCYRAYEGGSGPHCQADGEPLQGPQEEIPPQGIGAEGVGEGGRLLGEKEAPCNGLLRNEKPQGIDKKQDGCREDSPDERFCAPVHSSHGSTSRIWGSMIP